MKTPFIHNESSGSAIRPKDLSRCSTEDARALVPLEFAASRTVLPLGLVAVGQRELICVAATTRDPALEKEIQFLSQREVRIVVVPRTLIEASIQLAYRGSAHSVDEAVKDLCAKSDTAEIKSIREEGLRDKDNPEAHLFTTLIDHAILHGASDIHFTPRENGSFVRIRNAEGSLSEETRVCALDIHQRMIQRAKVLAKLDIAKHDVPQDGAFDIPLIGAIARARVSIMPTLYGERLVIRILGKEEIRSVLSLGYTDYVMNMFKCWLELNSGMIVLAGATGSGKTTSLYSMMKYLSQRGLNLVSVEDPIEIHVPWMSQTQIHVERGLTFGTVLRCMMRQDPDVIMIGEVRDSETAKAAYNSAITGHKVLCSIHAGSIEEIVSRFDLFGVTEAELFVTPLLLAHQVLVPRLCENCRKKISLDDFSPLPNMWESIGCERCQNTGYQGRVPLVDVITFSGRSDSISFGSRMDSEVDQRYITKSDTAMVLAQNGIICGKTFDEYAVTPSTKRLHTSI